MNVLYPPTAPDWDYLDSLDVQSIQGPCPHCFESSGYEVRVHPATWNDPAWDDADPTRPCPECNGTGMVECEPMTLDDLAEMSGDYEDAPPPEPPEISQDGRNVSQAAHVLESEQCAFTSLALRQRRMAHQYRAEGRETDANRYWLSAKWHLRKARDRRDRLNPIIT